jgi:hypothetical protein
MFKIRATLNCIDRRGKLSNGCSNALDKCCGTLSRTEKLSTIFVDNCVHHFYKGVVSWFFQSFFCIAIKKCASAFLFYNQYVEIMPRVTMRVSGRSPDVFVTFVDEEDNLGPKCQERNGRSIRPRDAFVFSESLGFVL